MKKDWRNLTWKDLNKQERIAFAVLCLLTAWLIVMALFYKLWSIPDWVVYLWAASAAAVLYWFRRIVSEHIAAEEDEESDEESIDE